MKRIGFLGYLLLGLAILAGPYGCGSEEHVNIFHATFEANEVPLNYSTKIGFLKIGDYMISYDQDRDHPQYDRNSLLIDLPRDVQAGDVYENPTQESLYQVTGTGYPHASLHYQDADGRDYSSWSDGAVWRITVNAWHGPGGYGEGTFYATFTNEEGHVVHLENGWFEGFIHN